MIYVLAVARVIGIILLVILAVVILVLVFPVTYKFDMDFNDRRGGLQVYWLFHLIRFRIGFDEDMELVLSILFFNIDFLDEAWRENRRIRKKKRDEKKKIEAEIEEVEEKLSRRMVRLARTTVRVLNLVREYEIINEAMDIFRLFLFRIRPRDIHGYVSFGMSDPSQTGMIIGAVSAFPAIYRTDLSIAPDFEAEEIYIKGDIHAKGHIFMLHLLFLLVGLVRRKKIRLFIGELRHHN